MIIPPSAKSPSPNFIPSPPSLPSPLFSSSQPSFLPSPSTTPLLFSPSAFYSSFSFLSSYFSLPSPSPSPFLSNATDLNDLHHHYHSRRNHRKIRESGLHESYRGTQRGQNRVADDGPWHGSSRSVGVGVVATDAVAVAGTARNNGGRSSKRKIVPYRWAPTDYRWSRSGSTTTSVTCRASRP